MIADEAYEALEEAVGPEYASREPAVMDGYSWQAHMNVDPDIWIPRPEAVVLPGSAEEVQAVVRACNKHGLKLKAFCVGWGPFAGPGKEGVIQVDLRRMDRILEIDEKNMIAVVEPYVIAGALQAEAMKVGLNTHIIGAGPGHSPLAAATSLLGTGWDGIYMSNSFRNLLGVEWVLPSGEVLRAGTPGSGSGWFCGDGPGPSLRGIMRGWLGTSGSLGIFTKCALKLFNWPGPPKPEINGTLLDVRTEEMPNFGTYMCLFPDREKYAEAIYKVGEAETGYIHHKTSHPLLLAFLAPRFTRKLSDKRILREALLALRHQFTLILAADTERELVYQKSVLAAIVSDQQGVLLDLAAFPSIQQMLFWGMVRSSLTPLVFRPTGNYFAGFGTDESLASQSLADELGEPVGEKGGEEGNVLDEFGDDVWAPTYENTNRAHCEHILLFDHRHREHSKAVAGYGREYVELGFEKFLAPGLVGMTPDVRKIYSSRAFNFNEYQKKIVAALDEGNVSDTTWYTDEAD